MKTIQVKVKPNSRQVAFVRLEEGGWLAQVKSLPVDGKANKEMLALVAKHFKLKKSEVVLKSGARSPIKQVTLLFPDNY